MRVLVRTFEVLLVDMRVPVGLSVVTVFVLVLNVFMIVQDVRMRMCHIPVSVLMGVLPTGHRLLHS